MLFRSNWFQSWDEMNHVLGWSCVVCLRQANPTDETFVFFNSATFLNFAKWHYNKKNKRTDLYINSCFRNLYDHRRQDESVYWSREYDLGPVIKFIFVLEKYMMQNQPTRSFAGGPGVMSHSLTPIMTRVLKKRLKITQTTYNQKENFGKNLQAWLRLQIDVCTIGVHTEENRDSRGSQAHFYIRANIRCLSFYDPSLIGWKPLKRSCTVGERIFRKWKEKRVLSQRQKANDRELTFWEGEYTHENGTDFNISNSARIYRNSPWWQANGLMTWTR